MAHPMGEREAGVLRLDGGKYGQMAFRIQENRKIRHRLAAEKTPFPRRPYGGMISANLEVIWEISARYLDIRHVIVLREFDDLHRLGFSMDSGR